MFDYGTTVNMIKYGQTTPPAYNLAKMPQDLPMAMYSGLRDTLADPTGNEFVSILPKRTSGFLL